MAKKQRRFEFKGRSSEAIRARQERLDQGNKPNFDNWLNSDIPRLNTQEPGDYRLRILPPPEEYDPGHHGYDIYVHFDVGSNNQQYLCRDWMGKGNCPICEERIRAFNEGEQEYGKQLFPTRRVGVYVINRNDEDQGPLFFGMPVKVDWDLWKGMEDPVSGEVTLIDDPDEGMDFVANRQGKGKTNTNWEAGISKRSSPLHEDEKKASQWLDWVLDHPIPEQLIFYDYERIKEVFEGGDQEEEDDTPQSFRQQSVESEDRSPAEEEVTQEPESEPEPDPDPEPEPESEENGSRRRRRRRTSGIADQLQED